MYWLNLTVSVGLTDWLWLAGKFKRPLLSRRNGPLADIILNPSTVRSFEQAIPDSEYNSERHANLYQLVGRAAASLNKHETSARRDRQKTSPRVSILSGLEQVPSAVLSHFAQGG